MRVSPQADAKPASGILGDRYLRFLCIGLVADVCTIVGSLSLLSAPAFDLTIGLVLFINILVILPALWVLSPHRRHTVLLSGGGKSKGLPRYVLKWRIVAGVALGLAIICNLGWFIYPHLPKSPPKDRLRLAVAPFQSSPAAADLAEDTLHLIRERVEEHRRDSVPIEALVLRGDGLVVSKEQARSRGRKAGAHLVLWGSVARLVGGSVEINYHLTWVADPGIQMVDLITHRRVHIEATKAYGPRKVRIQSDGLAQLDYGPRRGSAIYLDPDIAFALSDATLTPGEQHIRSIEEMSEIVVLCAGIAYMMQGADKDLQRAKALFDGVVSHSPVVSVMARYYSGRCLGSLSFSHIDGESPEWENACAHFREAILAAREALAEDLSQQDRLLMNTALTYSYISHGLLLEASDRWLDAIAEFGRAVAHAPENAPAHYILGNALCRQDRLDEGIVEYYKALELDQNDLPSDVVHHSLAVAFHQQGKLNEAIAELRETLRINPDYAEARCNMGHALLELGKPGDAMVEFRKAIKLDPNQDVPHLGIAMVLWGQGRLKQAIDEYRKAIRINPDCAPAYCNLGGVLVELGRPEEAMAELREAIRLDPDEDTSHFNLGFAFWRQGKLEEAIAEYRVAIGLNPKDADYRGNLANALREQGDVEEAIAKYREAIGLDPDNVLAHTNLGAMLHAQGKLEDAIAEHRKAIRLDPDNVLAHTNLGATLHEQGKLKEAIAEYREGIRLNPDDAVAHNNLGYMLYEQGKLAEAIAEYRDAIGLDPDIAMPHINLGRALRDMGKLDGAVTQYRRAIALDPDDYTFHGNLGLVLQAQGRLDEAIAAYRAAIRFNPQDPASHTNLGNALYDMGREREAMAEYRKAAALTPTDYRPHYNLGLRLQQQGKLGEAIIEFRKAAMLDPDKAVYHKHLGWTLALHGESDEAVLHYRRYLELEPNAPGAAQIRAYIREHE